MAHEYPKAFARFYDTIYQELRDDTDHQFFLDKIAAANCKVLEIGVGTGRFFIDALNSGADAYGIDVSREMLNVLKNKLSPANHHRVGQQSITNFHFKEKFNLILAPFRVMMHVLEKENQLKALNNVFNHLAPEGTFIFDTFVPNPKHLTEGMDKFIDFEGEHAPGQALRRIVSTSPDIVNQQIQVHFRLEWEEKGQAQAEDWHLPMRLFFRYELEHLLERSLFGENYEILGDYKGNPLCKDSKEFIVICKKS
jgi:SAM-dependent methyltransferase